MSSSETTVFRVENDDGKGPYNDGVHDTLFTPLFLEFDPEQQPMPWTDGLPTSTIGFHFGFESVRAYCDWFTANMRRWMRENGFSLSKYAARDVVRGNHQVVFDKSTARLEGRDTLPL